MERLSVFLLILNDFLHLAGFLLILTPRRHRTTNLLKQRAVSLSPNTFPVNRPLEKFVMVCSAFKCQNKKYSSKGGRLDTAEKLFDRYARSYELALSNALAPSGESREYFAEGRVEWLKRCLGSLGTRPRNVLDFGCGDGSTTPILQRILDADICTGVDVSAKSLDVARKHFATKHIRYELLEDLQAEGQMDLAYCNGVFHHIAPAERKDALGLIRDALKPGGLFAFWENNSWNPATRYIISRCPFDKDAILLSPLAARALLKEAGFEMLRIDFRFIFPRFLRSLRRVEDFAIRLPFGAQYQILCRKAG